MVTIDRGVVASGGAHYAWGVAPTERLSRTVAVVISLGVAAASGGALAVAGVLALREPSELALEMTPRTLWCTALILVLQSTALLLRLRSARLALDAVALLPVLLGLAAPSELFSITALPVLVAAFLVGLDLRLKRLPWVALEAAALVAVGQAVNAVAAGRTDLGAIVLESAGQATIVIGLPLLPATLIAAQRQARTAQRATLDALTRERDAQIGEALARERTAMARELHDIAAHHLSGISVMASAIGRQVVSDPEAARAGAAQIREQSNDVLEDLRRLVGLLRDPGSTDESVKTLATIPALIEAAAASGAVVRLEVIGEPSELGVGIGPLGQLAAYRMVQESITNALRHAPGSTCTVRLDESDARRLRIEVVNTAAAAGTSQRVFGSGFGLLGMQERATLIGGAFDAGPSDDDGWRARMSIPRESCRTDRKVAS